MIKAKKYRTRLVAVGVAGLMLVTACSSKSSSKSAASSVAATTPAAASAPVVSSSTAASSSSSTAASAPAAASGAASGTFKSRVTIPQTPPLVDTAKYKKTPPWTIGYSDASLSNSARTFIWQFTQWAASTYPEIKKIVRTDANDNPNQQVSDIQNLVSQHVSCLIVSATSQTAIDPAIDAAQAAGIPVVIQERDVNTNSWTSFVDTQTYQIGTLQAEAVAKILGGKGNVVLLEGLAGNGAAEQTHQGHVDTFKKYPGIHILATQYSGWDPAKGKTIMEGWLQAFPHIDAVVSDSGLQNAGAYEAVQAAGRLSEIKAWTGDSLQQWIRQVQADHIPGAIVNRPLRFGAEAVDDCANILAGNTVPKRWYDPVEALDMNNLAKYITPNTAGSDQWWDWWDLPAQWEPKA